MGAWGVGSDENDPTWDAVGMSIQDRTEGGHFDEENAKKFIEELTTDGCDFSDLGVCVLLLKMGCTMKAQDITLALASLQSEVRDEDNGAGWISFATRKRALLSEAAFLQSALDQGGKPPGQPVGARGIFARVIDGRGDSIMSFDGQNWLCGEVTAGGNNVENESKSD